MSAPLDSSAEVEAWLLLAATPGLARLLPALAEALPTPLALLSQPPSALAALGLDARARTWLARPDRRAVAPALRWLRGGADRHLLAFGQGAYPPLLATIADPPAVLFARGDPLALARPAVAIVGARQATPAGAETAFCLARELGEAGFLVVSGLARGIDGAAHRGALAGPGPTAAVMATGPDLTYPRSHGGLADAIAGAGGVLLTEFAPGAPALRHHFPRRNRLIAGLCTATVVVEAAEHSGSLITARLAAEQGREVLAVPGSVRSPQSRGCHRLLREGAGLAESAADVVAALPALLGALAPPPAAAAEAGSRDGPDATADGLRPAPAGASASASRGDGLSSDYRQVLESLGYDPATTDEIVARSGLTAVTVCSILPALEVQGLVSRQLDGAYLRAPPGSRSR